MTRLATVTLALGFLATALAKDDRPNILFILADDFNFAYKQDRQAIMPTMTKYLAEEGIELHNHQAAVPVCGPSRSSFLAGRYPHNAGYVANGAKASIAAWRRQENNTVGTWLTQSGYYTAFLGKYVNSMECDVPSGWRHWGGLTCSNLNGAPLGGTYNYKNSSQWQVDFAPDGVTPTSPADYHIWEGVHQKHFLSAGVLDQVDKAIAEDRPFFVHTTPLMMHWGTCQGPQPADKYAFDDPHWEFQLTDPEGKLFRAPISACPSDERKHQFDGVTNPHVPSYNTSATGDVPDWIQRLAPGPLTSYEGYRQDIGYRNRSVAAVDLDDFMKVIFEGLEQRGVLNNTYIVWSGDNGYHLGEHRLLLGKCEPYDTDVRVPMYVRGPGIQGGRSLPFPTNHIDITATIVDWAKAEQTAPTNLDGKSFASVLEDTDAKLHDYRTWGYSEFYVNTNTWLSVRSINATTGQADYKYTLWCTNQSEVFDLVNDPWELDNQVDNAYGQSIQEEWLPKLMAMSTCKHDECQNPQGPRVPVSALQCHQAGPHEDVIETYLDP